MKTAKKRFLKILKEEIKNKKLGSVINPIDVYKSCEVSDNKSICLSANDIKSILDSAYHIYHKQETELNWYRR